MVIYDHYYSRITLAGNWQLLSQNKSLKIYPTDDESPGVWELFEALDDTSNAELISPVPNARELDVRLFFKAKSKVVKGAKANSGGKFLRYKTDEISREEPMQVS